VNLPFLCSKIPSVPSKISVKNITVTQMNVQLFIYFIIIVVVIIGEKTPPICKFSINGLN
jgi:hypothetical protein